MHNTLQDLLESINHNWNTAISAEHYMLAAHNDTGKLSIYHYSHTSDGYKLLEPAPVERCDSKNIQDQFFCLTGLPNNCKEDNQKG
ncbi:MAG: hypothetical protein U9N34_01520 [Candidatus Cloacimonadota bacterium]|nr:hypothetical protein [Candidatus Cloacimonadota bacterium]